MPWGSTGYCRKEGDYLRTSDTGSLIGYDRTYGEYVEKYGEENARYIWESIHPDHGNDTVIYINNPETFDEDIYNEFVKEAGEDSRVILETGNLGLLEKFINGDWNEEFLVIPSGKAITAVYDRIEIMKETNCKK